MSTKPKTLLIVDDDEEWEHRDPARDYTVLTASTGEAGLEMLARVDDHALDVRCRTSAASTC
jgi:hypothetical protein